MRLLSLALALFAACASAPKAQEDPIELGRRLASDPRDWVARRDLAKLRQAEGLWGEALREYLVLERQQKLGPEERLQLGKLLAARAKARAELADPAALQDLEHAISLGVADDRILPRALELAAVAALRHSSAFTREQARSHLTRLASISPDDPRTQQESLIGLDLDLVLTILGWFQDAGAKRQALRVAEHYVRSGGRDSRAVDQWLELHRWWYGTRRPPLPSDAASSGAPEIPDLQRLEAALLAETAPAREAVWQTLTDDWKIELWAAELAAIDDAFKDDPARADRLSRRFVDGAVYGARRLAALTELFHRLGDSVRAKHWGIELATLSRSAPAFTLAAGLACAFDADLGPANHYFISAASASGDPGRYWAIAARALREAGHYLAAVAANRRALALTAPGRDMRILLELHLAQAELGRKSDAERSMEMLLSRVKAAEQDQVRALVAQAERAFSRRGPDMLSEIRAELGF